MLSVVCSGHQVKRARKLAPFKADEQVGQTMGTTLTPSSSALVPALAASPETPTPMRGTGAGRPYRRSSFWPSAAWAERSAPETTWLRRRGSSEGSSQQVGFLGSSFLLTMAGNGAEAGLPRKEAPALEVEAGGGRARRMRFGESGSGARGRVRANMVSGGLRG